MDGKPTWTSKGIVPIDESLKKAIRDKRTAHRRWSKAKYSVKADLEYAQAVWAPHLSKHVNMIENVQKRATSMVDGLRDIEYNDRLQLINIPTLSMRRARGDMIEVWKHFHIYDRSTVANAFRPRPRVTRRHKLQLFNNRSLDGVRGIQRNSFYHRTVDVWNQLPSYVAESKTINNFKNNLDRYWSVIPPM